MTIRLPAFAPFIDALRQDTRYSLRGIRTRPAFTAIVTLTIALGIGANATMFGVLDRLLFRAPEHVRDPERVVQIETHRAGSRFAQSSFSYASYTDFRDRATGFSGVAMVWTHTVPLGRGITGTRVPGALVSHNFFATLGVRPERGRFFAADDDDPDRPRSVAVISDGFWRRQFGGRGDAVGQTLDVGTQRYTVIGVAPRGFSGIDLKDVDVWLPVTAAAGLRFDKTPGWTRNRGAQWLTIIARIKDGVDARLVAEQATAVHRAALRQRLADEPQTARFIQPDSESVVLVSLIPGKVPAGLGGAVGAQDVRVAKLLSVVSLLVLLIACANVANLLLVRAFGRRREIAVRLALGVSRRRLIAQLFIDGLLLSLLGGTGALLVVHWTSQSLRTLLLGADAWRSEPVDGRMLAFTAAVTLATGIVTSLVPALRASRGDLAMSLKQGVREGGGHRSRLRSGLIVVQAAFAILLLGGAGVFIQSIRNVNALPFGVDLDQTLIADVSHTSVGLTTADANRLYHEFADRVRRVPGVTAVAVTVGLPLGLNWGTELFVPGRTLPKLRQQPAQYAVTPEYFRVFGIRLINGRVFTMADVAGAPAVAIVNETMARVYWPNQNPVGTCAKIGADTMPCTTIIGVVSNTVRQGLNEGLVPQVYRPLDQLPLSYVERTVSFFGYELVVRTSGDPSRLVDPVRRAMQSASTTVPYADVRPMHELLSRRTRAWELGSKVFAVFGGLALVLAALGLYSVLTFTIAQRLHEFGVRLALGAQSSDLVRVSVGAGLAPVVGGIVAGVSLALLGGRFVVGLLFDVSPRDPAILGGVCAILLATGVLASVVPAWRATRVDPAGVLRSD